MVVDCSFFSFFCFVDVGDDLHMTLRHWDMLEHNGKPFFSFSSAFIIGFLILFMQALWLDRTRSVEVRPSNVCKHNCDTYVPLRTCAALLVVVVTSVGRRRVRMYFY